MRPGRVIAGYGLLVLVAGSLLAPWAFHGVALFSPDIPFRRVYGRSLMAVALLALWPALRWAGVGGWSEIGLPRRPGWWRELLYGLVLGIASLGVAGMVGAEPHLRHDWAGWWARVPGYVGVALLVGTGEELFFRGGLQSALQRGLRPVTAVSVISVVYAALHFLSPKGLDVPAAAVTWRSGFDYLALVIADGCRWREFVTLLLVGQVLGWARVWTRALYLAIGLHVGWIVTLKSYGYLAADGELTGGVFAWPALVILGGFLWWRCRR